MYPWLNLENFYQKHSPTMTRPLSKYECLYNMSRHVRVGRFKLKAVHPDKKEEEEGMGRPLNLKIV